MSAPGESAWVRTLRTVLRSCRHADGGHVHAPLLIVTWFAELAAECGRPPETTAGAIECPCCNQRVRLS